MTRRSFQAGLELGAGSFYLLREADKLLPEHLLRGEFCAVFAPRQTGKSSLRARAEGLLREAGVRTLSVDLSSLGIDSSDDEEDRESQWYYTLARRLASPVGAEEALDAVWAIRNVSNVERLRMFLYNHLAERVTPTVVFLDEIDRTVTLPFDRDDFFGLIREVSNARHGDSRWGALTFCILGVVTPLDLSRSPQRSSVALGSVLSLDDFSREELAPLADGLSRLPGDPQAYLDAIYAWTSGHPAMTQRVCAELTELSMGVIGTPEEVVGSIVKRVYLVNGVIEEAILNETYRRFEPVRGGLDPTVRIRLLRLYEQVLAPNGRLLKPGDPDQFGLRISGLTTFRDGHLVVRNKIFATVFNRRWIEAQFSDRLYLDRARKWEETHDDNRLPRGKELAEITEWASTHDDLLTVERLYVEAAQRVEVLRNRRRLWAVSAVLAASVVVATAMAILWLRAQDAGQRAETALHRTQDALRLVRAQEIAGRARGLLPRLSFLQPATLLPTAAEAIVLRQEQMDSFAADTRIAIDVDEAVSAVISVLERGVPLVGHTGPVTMAAFSPDGRRVVTASADGTARTWDATTGRPIQTLFGQSAGVTIAGLSRDGQRILTVSADGTARVWDVETGRPLARLVGTVTRIGVAAFSLDNRWVVTALADGTDRVWNTLTGEILGSRVGQANTVAAAFSADGHRCIFASVDGSTQVWAWDASANRQPLSLAELAFGIGAVAFSPDDQRVVTASADGTVRTWSATTGAALATLTERTNQFVEPAAAATFSPDGQRIITASDDGIAWTWDAATGQPLATLAVHTAGITAAAFSPDGRRVVTTSFDHTARIWDATPGRRLAALTGHNRTVTAAAFSQDGRRVLTASLDRTARAWNPATGAPTVMFAGHSGEITAAAFSPDGQRVVTASNDHSARIWNAVTGQPLRVLVGHTSEVTAAMFSADGRYVVTASADDTARTWDAVSGELRATFIGHTSGVVTAAFSSDGGRIVTASADNTARTWNASTGALLATLVGHTYWVTAAAFSPDGIRIVTASGDRTARLWNAASGRPLAVLAGHGGQVVTAAFSPDGRQVVTASDDGTARTWDALSGAPLTTLAGHTDRVTTASFSPDSTRVVTASGDRTARIWNAATGQLLAVLAGHASGIATAVFSPDGKQVVTASASTARIWNVDADERLRQACMLIQAWGIWDERADLRNACGVVGTSSRNIANHGGAARDASTALHSDNSAIVAPP